MAKTGRGIPKLNTKIVRQGRAGKLFLEILLAFACCIFLGGMPKEAKAAGATITIAANNPEAAEGEAVHVTITVSASDVINGFEGYFTYDNRVLQFVRGGNVVHGNDDAFRISDLERSDSAVKITYSVKFLARKKGSTAISLRKPYAVTSGEDNASKLPVSYNTLWVTVRERGSKSTNAPAPTESLQASAAQSPSMGSPEPTRRADDIAGSNRLRRLSVKGVPLAPDFSSDIQKYSAIATTSKKKLSISYQAEDSLAKVTVQGNKNLAEGKNIIKIAVTGTDGEKRVYRLSVTIQKPASAGGKSSASNVTVSKKNGKTSLKGNMAVELSEPEKGIVPPGFAKTEVTVDGKIVTAYALKSSTEMDFVLFYGKGNKEEFYLYDTIEQMLMPYEKAKAWYQGLDGDSALEKAAQEKTVQSLKYVVGILAAFCGLMGIIAVAALMRPRHS